MKTISLLLFGLLGIILTSGCVQNTQEESHIPEFIDEDPSTEVQDISMNVVVGTYEPNQITVKKGVPVRLAITGKEIDPNSNFTTHGFAIKELGIDERIEVGKTTIVEFTPTQAGSFVFYCSVYCGQGHIGQTGIMHVIE